MEFQQCDVYFFIRTLSQNGYSATKIHQLLANVWGEKNIMKVRRIQAIVREFVEGRETVTRKEGSGRPRSSCCDENIEEVKELIEDDNHLSCADISLQTGVEERSVHRILSHHLNKKSLCCRWIPHELSDRNKQQRIECGRSILETLRRRQIKSKLVVVDEKWVYYKSIPPKECNRVWVDCAGDRPQVSRRTIADRKVLIMVALNYAKSFSYIEVLHDGGSINGDRYLSFLQNMCAAFEQQLNLPRWEMCLQHDNARPHIAMQVRRWIDHEGMSLVKQPPYSPDYNLLDRYVFRNFEVHRRQRNFGSIAEIEARIEQFLAGMTIT